MFLSNPPRLNGSPPGSEHFVTNFPAGRHTARCVVCGVSRGMWNQRLSDFLGRHPLWMAALASFASFATYFCAYGFRRPFAAASYEGTLQLPLFAGHPIDLKTLFVIAQVIGYCLSKFLGTKVCSEIPRGRLWHAMTLSITVAWFALLLFAVLPVPLKAAAIFLNGLPLGMVWGFVVRHLEGRRVSELLLAALSCSFILSSGEVKRAGASLMAAGVPEYWMPFATGAIYFVPFVPFVLCAGLLSLLPAPDRRDVEMRSKRGTMDGRRRIAFVTRFLPGLIPLCVAYLFLTTYRDFRDNFQTELFHGMDIADPAAFTRTERPIALGVMLTMALLFTIRGNRAGLAATYLTMISGLLLMGFSTWFYDCGRMGGEMWMICSGLGVYLAYVPFGSILFDRTIALTRFAGTAVFAIYLADALGYTGSAVIQVLRDVWSVGTDRLQFFRGFTYVMTVGGVPLMTAAMVYFLRQGPAPNEKKPTN